MTFSIDCRGKTTREINRLLREAIAAGDREIRILEPDARHNLELTKLLRNPTIIDGEAVAQNDGNKADSEQAAGNDQPGNEAGSVQASVKRRPDAAPDAANSSEMLASLVGLREGDDDLCPD